jgi:hypothetical protein
LLVVFRAVARARSGRGTGWFIGFLVLLAAAGVGYWAFERFAPRPERMGVTPPPSARPPPNTIVDPLAPGRLVALDLAPRAATSTDWLKARPAFQYSRAAAERGGVNPCALPAADTSDWQAWSSLSKGHFTAPRAGAVDDTGGFDLVVYFHGDELARRELVESHQRFVLYALTLDPSESYAALFAGTKLFGQLVQQIEQKLGAARGAPAHARHVAVAAWSAGYMAVLSILSQPEAKDVDGVVLIDGLHGPRGGLERPLAPFVDFARRAETGERFMLVTHSSIDPPDFASTTEAAHYLLSALAERPRPVRRDDRLGLELIEYFTQGDFHVRGYAGNDKADHCAQVTLLRDAYAALGRRWHP